MVDFRDTSQPMHERFAAFRTWIMRKYGLSEAEATQEWQLIIKRERMRTGRTDSDRELDAQWKERIER